MTIPELQTKIKEIIEVIKQLQALLAQLHTFNTNLWYGTSSQEVIYLQRVLNQDPETQVSATGWGSPGNESMYFGAKKIKNTAAIS